MFEQVVRIYVWLFGRRVFMHWNKLLFRLSIGGLGILNYQSSRVSGESAFLRNYLPGCRGMLIDVGANKGDYIAEALKFNKKIEGFAFEPHPRTFELLVRNLAEYKSITPVNQGLSLESGWAKLYDYPDRDGSPHASFFKAVIEDIHHSEGAVAHDVEVTTLDVFVESEQLGEISLLKIDAEGNELNILKGGVKALSSGMIKAIHFEFNEMNVVSRTYFRDFWDLLSGYKIFRLLPDGMYEIKSYSPLHCEIFAYQNIVAIKV